MNVIATVFLAGLVLALAGIAAVGAALLGSWKPDPTAWLQRGHRIEVLFIAGLVCLAIAAALLVAAILMALLEAGVH